MACISARTCIVIAGLLLPLGLLPPIVTTLGKGVLAPAGRGTMPGLFSRASRSRVSPSCTNAAKHVIAVEMLLLSGLLPPNESRVQLVGYLFWQAVGPCQECLQE